MARSLCSATAPAWVGCVCWCVCWCWVSEEARPALTFPEQRLGVAGGSVVTVGHCRCNGETRWNHMKRYEGNEELGIHWAYWARGELGELYTFPPKSCSNGVQLPLDSSRPPDLWIGAGGKWALLSEKTHVSWDVSCVLILSWIQNVSFLMPLSSSKKENVSSWLTLRNWLVDWTGESQTKQETDATKSQGQTTSVASWLLKMAG